MIFIKIKQISKLQSASDARRMPVFVISRILFEYTANLPELRIRTLYD